MSEHKILFTGTMGAGKTTAIGAVSEITPLSTDVRNSDASTNKAMTTVGLDYGELTLDNGDKLRLYGTPGQKRFDFMWNILAKGALGLVILIDNSQPDPKGDLKVYIDGFRALINETACVVAIGKMDNNPLPQVDEFAQLLHDNGIMCPVIAADVRDSQQVVQILDLLLLQLEA